MAGPSLPLASITPWQATGSWSAAPSAAGWPFLIRSASFLDHDLDAVSLIFRDRILHNHFIGWRCGHKPREAEVRWDSGTR